MLNQEIVIREAVPSDIKIIMELLYLKARFDGCPESLKATTEQLNNDLFGTTPLTSILLAEVGGKAVGFASYHRIYSTFLAKPGIWLDDLYLKAEYRGKKIGTALMTRLYQIAEETGCGRIDWTVNINNDNGIQFYEKMGANIIEKVRLCRLEIH
ncbi:MAG: GNAT family N-acetyltransferase [Okeania sp. SIO2G4]|uniref:GNAT family N-acetyltransferase n=1 Tax=unclassified Okeania TaxID=2634635 RepID=UPI0013B7DEAA|nr:MULTISPECIES: GNAT family N-acetyltransferase [unclassified Okeania]NEP04133.1 GNAT family N-acetyltransferase [Okeania sp. SIO4D6]NEP41734.1 GNAT family N-acetyltransferase [Okeania sp. SIO2H7]NEP70805.1 GNAT family N-acetyltransferase [Okeania sp. SIO2G5]NEP93548.1 GNAT family N-acetyltransferase [Okeania sp. SIO2F5]NEQ93676.1 GNAT family N-acetyltransferase [Okeania sp. SIO2G4]